MIRFITGAPGSGKTLTAVLAIAEQVKQNHDPKAVDYSDIAAYAAGVVDGSITEPMDFKQSGSVRRQIFTDIDGINFETDTVHKVDSKWDWRTAPDGSLIVLDEVHQRWPSTGKSGRATDETIRDLDTHRHRGFDFILLSQFPTKVHFEVRTNCSEHSHLLRIAGSKFATVFTWPRVVTDPNDWNTRQEADKKPFKYPKSIFKHYKSANIHTAKFKMPATGWFLIALFSVLAIVFVRNLSASIENRTDIEPQSAAAIAGVQAEPALAAVNTSVYSGCISSDVNCLCYDEDYRPVSMDFLACKAMMNKPLPTVPKISSDK